MLQEKTSIRRARRSAAGFTLVETLVAIGLLAVGVVGLATLIPYATRNDYRTRIDTTATFVAMQELEQILAQPFSPSNPCGAVPAPCFMDAPDPTGSSVVVNLADGGKPLLANGNMDFTGTAPAGYQRPYTIQPMTGNTVKVNAMPYEIRWYISTTNGVRTIVIAALPVGNVPGIVIPANLRAVKMR